MEVPIAQIDVEEVQAQLDFLSAKLLQMAPRSCCPHEDAPCMGCALEWLVAESIPVSLSPGFRGEYENPYPY